MKDFTIRQPGGFTLIEVMIVVAIVAILASIALPAYNDQMRKSRRTDVQREMISHAQELERWFSANGSYLNGAACGASHQYGKSADYYAAVAACTATTFTITATPNSGGPQASDGNQVLGSDGTRTGTWKY